MRPVTKKSQKKYMIWLNNKIFYAETWRCKPVDLLLGRDMKSEYLNDYTLGHALDEIYEYGVTNLFMEIASEILKETNLYDRFRRIDSTSISVEVAYYGYPNMKM